MPRYSRARIRADLNAIDASQEAHGKGAALETLGRYLFEQFRGVECEDQNILEGPRAHELDLAFWNDQRRSEIYFLDALLVVECKATARPVTSADVGWFVRKLQTLGATHGILIALNGITGEGDTAAHSEVLNAFIRDNIRILLIDRDDILALGTTADLSNALKNKILNLTLKKVVHLSATQ